MRRSQLLTIRIHCPHFQRPVDATRNEMNERLVDCADKTECVRVETAASGVAVSVYPQSCPVFRSVDGSRT